MSLWQHYIKVFFIGSLQNYKSTLSEYCSLPFLINLLHCLDGVEVIADDILCYGSRESMREALADHDRNLENLKKVG